MAWGIEKLKVFVVCAHDGDRATRHIQAGDEVAHERTLDAHARLLQALEYTTIDHVQLGSRSGSHTVNDYDGALPFAQLKVCHYRIK